MRVKQLILPVATGEGGLTNSQAKLRRRAELIQAHFDVVNPVWSVQ